MHIPSRNSCRTTRTPHCFSDCNLRIPAASSSIRTTFMPITRLLTLHQLFRYEDAQRSDDRHLLGVEILEIDLPDKVLTRGHHHFNEGQGVQHSRQQYVVVIGKIVQRALPAIPQLAVKKVCDKHADVVRSRTVHEASPRIASKALRSN